MDRHIMIISDLNRTFIVKNHKRHTIEFCDMLNDLAHSLPVIFKQEYFFAQPVALYADKSQKPSYFALIETVQNDAVSGDIYHMKTLVALADSHGKINPSESVEPLIAKANLDNRPKLAIALSLHESNNGHREFIESREWNDDLKLWQYECNPVVLSDILNVKGVNAALFDNSTGRVAFDLLFWLASVNKLGLISQVSPDSDLNEHLLMARHLQRGFIGTHSIPAFLPKVPDITYQKMSKAKIVVEDKMRYILSLPCQSFTEHCDSGYLLNSAVILGETLCPLSHATRVEIDNLSVNGINMPVTHMNVGQLSAIIMINLRPDSGKMFIKGVVNIPLTTADAFISKKHAGCLDISNLLKTTSDKLYRHPIPFYMDAGELLKAHNKTIAFNDKTKDVLARQVIYLMLECEAYLISQHIDNASARMELDGSCLSTKYWRHFNTVFIPNNVDMLEAWKLRNIDHDSLIDN